MIYNYKCCNCSAEETINQPMNDPLPKNIPCKKCKTGKLNQDLVSKIRTMAIHIPCTFSATSEYAPKNYGGEDSLSDWMSSQDN